MSTTEKAPASDPFASLFEAATVEDVNKKKAPRPKWEGDIPSALRNLVKKAAGDGKRVVLPCPNVEMYDQVIAMAAAAAEKDAPGKVVYGTARHDDKGNITHVTFTVGEKRGRKAKAEDQEGPVAPVAPQPPTQSARKTAGATNK